MTKQIDELMDIALRLRSASPIFAEEVADELKIATEAALKPGGEPAQLTGATLQTLHNEMEPLSTMENEAQVSAWWKHFAGKVRLKLKKYAPPAQTQTKE